MLTIIIVVIIIGLCTIVAMGLIADLANRIKNLEDERDRSNNP